jgi:hypothetical protein
MVKPGDVVTLPWLGDAPHVAITHGPMYYVLPVAGPYNIAVCLREVDAGEASPRLVYAASEEECKTMHRWYSAHQGANHIRLAPLNQIIGDNGTASFLRYKSKIIRSVQSYAKGWVVPTNTEAPPITEKFRPEGYVYPEMDDVEEDPDVPDITLSWAVKWAPDRKTVMTFRWCRLCGGWHSVKTLYYDHVNRKVYVLRKDGTMTSRSGTRLRCGSCGHPMIRNTRGLRHLKLGGGYRKKCWCGCEDNESVEVVK